MAAKKVVFLGSKPIGYECFKELIKRRDSLDIDIVALLTQPRKEFAGDNDLASLALQNGIPVLNSPDEIPPCDLLYSVQYHIILKAEHIARAGLAVNLHMAPLPEYRGSNQFSFAILDGKTEFGTTIHVMDTRIDHGDILFQKRFAIPDNCWVHELYELTRKASYLLFSQTIAHILAGNYNPVPQERLVTTYGSSLHYRNEMNQIKQIDLNWDTERIERHIRATSMPGFEPPYTFVGGKKVHFSAEGGN